MPRSRAGIILLMAYRNTLRRAPGRRLHVHRSAVLRSRLKRRVYRPPEGRRSAQGKNRRKGADQVELRLSFSSIVPRWRLQKHRPAPGTCRGARLLRYVDRFRQPGCSVPGRYRVMQHKDPAAGVSRCKCGAAENGQPLHSTHTRRKCASTTKTADELPY